MVLHRARPVVGPVGEARSNLEVFGALLERLGLQQRGDGDDPRELTEAILGASASRALEHDGLEPPDGPRPVLFRDVLPITAERKVALVPPELDREATDGLYHFRDDPQSRSYPLALISPATSQTISSTFGQLDDSIVAVELHPEDAAARGLDGEAADRPVRVFNELGEVHCRWRPNPDLRPGVALLPKGLWAHRTLNGATANALAPDALADLGGGATFNDARVEVALLR